MSLYNKALRKVMERVALQNMKKATHDITYKEAEDNFMKELKNAADRILNGEFDEEIEKEMEIIKKEEELEKIRKMEREER